MRIYGKTLPEIFQMLPWPYKIVVTLGTAFFLFAVPYSLNTFINLGIASDKVEPLEFPGLDRTVRGKLDPSLASDGKNNVLLAHTSISAVEIEGQTLYSTSINLERSKPPCRNWTTLPSGYPAQQFETVGPDGVNPLEPPGVWVAETPSVVYDPDDRGREWKLYVYEYFWNGNEEFARLYGFIGVKTASSPDGPWTDKEWLFAPTAQQPPPPYNALVRQHLNPLSAELADVYFYARPSVVSYKKMLFMTLSAFSRTSKSPDRAVLLASTDHGKTWGYRGTILRASDLDKMGGYTRFGGGSLVVYQDRVYFAAVLGNDKVDALGTFMLPFENPNGLIEAKLQRDAKTGAPAIANWVKRHSLQPSALGGGFAAYSGDCGTGMLVSEFSGITNSFQIFKTYKKPLGE